ncbi:Methyltransferase domain-containing protein [Micromonospora viridifaciens]|uniref:Methyltransferase domain-containing protein n=1 Tax=Micromonospora viridifaciens TaxID=1881 RepID=A0A1C4YN94_MICVI|nr:class I SAM-dependent methyltransferase [Micromonospora viridifaciens]SCF22219.1 Methyltransferase domain-containing protein [Micromonospora viridifaciens]
MAPSRRTRPRRVGARDDAQLAAEWDRVAADRDRLIAEGRDLSYRYILLPALLELSSPFLRPGAHIVDAGCGTGKFAAELAAEYPDNEIIGLDPSGTSVEIARTKRPQLANLAFRQETVESFAADVPPRSTDLIIANMLFQNVSSLSRVLEACVRLLASDGALVFAVPHPCFWPRYWKYEKAPWFRYDQEFWIEAPFRTSLAPDAVTTTSHTHRPLERYVDAFRAAGLNLEKLVEPYPDEGIEGEYPIAWEFPRFLVGRCRPTDAPSPRP